jgi:hypothetical protein
MAKSPKVGLNNGLLSESSKEEVDKILLQKIYLPVMIRKRGVALKCEDLAFI